MKPLKAIRIDKAIGIDSISMNEESAIPSITIRGYASKMYDSEKKLVIDADSENIDTMGIDVSRLRSGNLPLLYGHDQKSAVGKITSAEYKPDGLVIEAIVYKLPNDNLTNYAYEAVKAGIITSFSVGILVEEFDVVEQDGNDYLQLAKSVMIETSLVSVPSNSHATFQIQEVNDGTQKSFSTIISKGILKQENPNACKEFGQCVLATKAANTAEKDLTYDDTKNSDWMKNREFSLYLDSLLITIEDNWYTQKWDELSSEDALSNIKKAFEDFLEDQKKLLGLESDSPSDIVSVDDGFPLETLATGRQGKSSSNLKGNEMVTKDVVEGSQPEDGKKEEVVVEDKTKEEIIPEETQKQDPPKEDPSPKAQPEISDVTKVEEKETPAEIPEAPVRTLSELMEDISGLDVAKLEESELETVYESVTGVAELIEAMVEDQIKEELV